jgi:hypothetical protein
MIRLPTGLTALLEAFWVQLRAAIQITSLGIHHQFRGVVDYLTSDRGPYHDLMVTSCEELRYPALEVCRGILQNGGSEGTRTPALARQLVQLGA